MLDVDALNTSADAGENLVRDSAKGVGEDGDREVVAEYFCHVALFAVNVGDVYHADIHTDIAYVFSLLAVDETVAVAVAKMTVETIGIAYWDGCYTAVASECGATTVTNGVTCWYVANLKNGGLEGGYVVDDLIVAWIDAIKT